MSLDNSVPCYPELYYWPFVPVQPIQISSFGWYRDAGPQGGTYYVDLKDATGKLIPFFFDRFLGRLCFGSSSESGTDAAFLRRGSVIEREAFILIEGLATQSPQFAELLSKVHHAKQWAQRPNISLKRTNQSLRD
jgi:hypothetical protein